MNESFAAYADFETKISSLKPKPLISVRLGRFDIVLSTTPSLRATLRSSLGSICRKKAEKFQRGFVAVFQKAKNWRPWSQYCDRLNTCQIGGLGWADQVGEKDKAYSFYLFNRRLLYKPIREFLP